MPPARASLQARPFEELIIELAGAFVRVTTDKIDGEINRWLERIVLALGLDRGTIAEINPSDGWATFSHGWAREPEEIIGRSLNANTMLPCVKQKMLAGETVVMPIVDALPDEAAIDRESRRRYGPKSNVMIPIKVGGVVVAAAGFGALYRERSWPPQISAAPDRGGNFRLRAGAQARDNPGARTAQRTDLYLAHQHHGRTGGFAGA